MNNAINGDWVDLKKDNGTDIETLRAHFKGHAYDPHWHDSYLIGVTEQGVQQFHCRREKHTSTPGRTFFLEPGEIHDGDTRNPKGFTYRQLYLPQNWLKQQLKTLFEQCPDNFELSVDSTLSDDRRLAMAVSQAFLTLHTEEVQILRDGALDGMLELMTQHLYWRKVSSNKGLNQPVALKTKDYLHAHLRSNIGLQEIAQDIGCDRFRLNREFKRSFGLSPHAYLIQLRLVEARHLLRLGYEPADIATDLCFSDQSHLGRWFKRAYRLTPSDYQKRCTKIPD